MLVVSEGRLFPAFPHLSLPPVPPVSCGRPPMKEYVTVGQLNQIYGMPKVESSPTSPLRQSLQPGAVEPAFSFLPSQHGSSLSLSVEVCILLPSPAAVPVSVSNRPGNDIHSVTNISKISIGIKMKIELVSG